VYLYIHRYWKRYKKPKESSPPMLDAGQANPTV
jgi:hypothetical protein